MGISNLCAYFYHYSALRENFVSDRVTGTGKLDSLGLILQFKGCEGQTLVALL